MRPSILLVAALWGISCVGCAPSDDAEHKPWEALDVPPGTDVVTDDGHGDKEASHGDTEAGEEAALVVVTLNTHSFQEGGDSLEKLEEIADYLAAIDADIIGLNEVMSGTFWAYDYDGAEYSGPQIIHNHLEEVTGDEFSSIAVGFAHWDDGEVMSNMIISRYDMVEATSKSLTTTDFWPAPDEARNVVFVRVVVPLVGPVNIFLTHTSGFGSVDTSTQIAEIKQFMAEKYRGDESLALLMGDLNTPSTDPLYKSWLTSPPLDLVDTYAEANPDGMNDPTMVDGEHRIDYILAAAGGKLVQTPLCYTSSIIFDGEVHEGVESPVVSDHEGVVTVFSITATDAARQ